MDITVKEINKEDWNLLWPQIKQSSFLQSWEYGEAIKNNKNIKVKRIVFLNNSVYPLAIAQVLIKEFCLFRMHFGSVIKINRGPLLINQSFNDDSYSKIYILILKALKKYSRKSKWWLYFLTPELPDNNKNYTLMRNCGLIVNKNKYWGSSTISLLDNQNLIMKKFKSRWRRCYKKSLKENIIIDEVRDVNEAEIIVKKYNTKLQKENKFRGLSNDFIISLIKENNKNFNINIYIAHKLSKKNIKTPLGILLSTDHGSITTFLIGYLNKNGRELNANYQLFWNAIIRSKEHGKKIFDLGGMTGNTKQGIIQFKRGFNGNEYKLVGDSWGLSIF